MEIIISCGFWAKWICASCSTFYFESVTTWQAGKAKRWNTAKFGTFEFFDPFDTKISVAWTLNTTKEYPWCTLFLCFRARDLHSRVGKRYLNVDKKILFHFFTSHFSSGILTNLPHITHRKVCWIWWLLLTFGVSSTIDYPFPTCQLNTSSVHNAFPRKFGIMDGWEAIQSKILILYWMLFGNGLFDCKSTRKFRPLPMRFTRCLVQIENTCTNLFNDINCYKTVNRGVYHSLEISGNPFKKSEISYA